MERKHKRRLKKIGFRRKRKKIMGRLKLKAEGRGN